MISDKQFESLSKDFKHVKLIKLAGVGEDVHVFASIHRADFEAVKEVNRLWNHEDKRPEGYFILDRESRSLESRTETMVCVYAHESRLPDINGADRARYLEGVWT